MGWLRGAAGGPEVCRRSPREACQEGRSHHDRFFSSDATAYVEHIDPKVVLLDGRRLAELMIDFEVGVTTARSYSVKRVDSDYFEEA